jgi:hypothetical protein
VGLDLREETGRRNEKSLSGIGGAGEDVHRRGENEWKGRHRLPKIGGRWKGES